MTHKKVTKKELAKIARNYDLLLIVLFGSRACNQAVYGSDVDLAVQGTERLSPSTLARIAIALQTLYGEPRVDLVDIKNATPLLLRQIFSPGVLLYEGKKHLFAEMQIYADKIYIEAAPLFDLQARQLKRMIKQI